jgi:two-component system response regulator YesN
MSEAVLRVLVVDDEHMVRGLLKRCIDWKEIGMEIVGEASCSQEALELVERLNPDIIYTDICMPYMDGIEFSRLVFEMHPEIKIIILTGYEEFEYAKRSIKLGIADFLLKPVNDEEIRKSALLIKEKIQSERFHSDEYNTLKRMLEENRPYLKEKFLNEFIQGEMPAWEISEKQAYFNLDFESGLFQVAFLEMEQPGAGIGQGTEQKLLLRMQCMDAAKQYFRDDARIMLFFDNTQRIVVLSTDADIDFTECCEILRIMLVNKFKCILSIGIGNRFSGRENIRQACGEAFYALSYSAVLGKNQVISYNAVGLSQKKKISMKGTMFNEFEFYLKAGLSQKAAELFGCACDDVSPDGGNAVEDLWVLASNVLSEILSVMNETGLKLGDVFEDGHEPFQNIFRIHSLPEMKEYMASVICRTGSLLEKLKSRKVNKIISEVKEHISANLSDPELSLSSTASRVYLNPSYLSRIFKQETGQTFIEYLTKARMELAIGLLAQTDLKAYEIAERIGMQDPHYFSFSFKKYTGISINEYRRSSGNP